jgi:hypothetical protein
MSATETAERRRMAASYSDTRLARGDDQERAQDDGVLRDGRRQRSDPDRGLGIRLARGRRRRAQARRALNPTFGNHARKGGS